MYEFNMPALSLDQRFTHAHLQIFKVIVDLIFIIYSFTYYELFKDEFYGC